MEGLLSTGLPCLVIMVLEKVFWSNGNSGPHKGGFLKRNLKNQEIKFLLFGTTKPERNLGYSLLFSATHVLNVLHFFAMYYAFFQCITHY